MSSVTFKCLAITGNMVLICKIFGINGVAEGIVYHLHKILTTEFVFSLEWAPVPHVENKHDF